LQHIVRHLVAAGVKQEMIALEEGESAGPRPVGELLYGLAGLRGAEAQTRMTRLLADANRWSPYDTPKPELDAAPAPRGSLSPAVHPAPDAASLNEALFAMRETVAAVMKDGLVLSALGEANALVTVIDRVLVLSEKAGSPLAYREAKAVLEHLAGLPAANIDRTAKKALRAFSKRWQKHRFGTGAFDAADVLSARPSGRRARIVATIDPKKSTVASLKPLIAAGLNVPRLNLGHGTIEDHKRTIGFLRQAAAELGKPISILVDLPGPKIRLGKFDNPKNLEFNDIFLNAGDKVELTTADVLGNAKLLPVDYPTLADDVKVGDPVYLNDGTVKAKALRVWKDEKGVGHVALEILSDGKVYDRKGINLPGSKLSIATVPPEDVAAMGQLINDVDMFGVSFVRTAEDIFFARQKMADFGRVLPICAKIERPEALVNLEAIAAAADILMVARGDMGVELGDELVPEASRRINEVGNLLGKPTIVATEVLHSMVKSPRPTRGEVDGLYSAIHEQGADAIMLAKETSGGEYRVEAVQMAHAIIVQAEEALARAPYVAQREGLTADTANRVQEVIAGPVDWARRHAPQLLDDAATRGR
jgi:pyruvate kinase